MEAPWQSLWTLKQVQGDGNTGPKPNPTAKSIHSGLSRSIRFIFQSRCQFLSCFSRLIAPSMDSNISKRTSTVHDSSGYEGREGPFGSGVDPR